MKVGDLVVFSNRQLRFDFERLSGMVGILLEEHPRTPEFGFSGPAGWTVLWPHGALLMHDLDISALQDD